MSTVLQGSFFVSRIFRHKILDIGDLYDKKCGEVASVSVIRRVFPLAQSFWPPTFDIYEGKSNSDCVICFVVSMEIQ